jgi:menaquinone-9 beta-reductase
MVNCCSSRLPEEIDAPKMTTTRVYDLAIVGGGLAGLSLSILMSRNGHRVVLFEKETYPFHKVCGEYISMESRDFLRNLGLPLDDWQLPLITKLHITAPNGESVRANLPLGGFGISRFKLDSALANIAKDAGVTIFENTKVYDSQFEKNRHHVQTSAGLFSATVLAACYGKKSNLDVKWNRRFVQNDKETNFIGVKYHVKADLPDQEIALHNFPGGYCGISKIEEDRYCLCYLTRSQNLKNSMQSISAMENSILKQNPVLRKLLNEMKLLFDEPVTIAQISFSKKTQVENHVLCIGDAAGMITPLCGNGMSMALHGSVIAAKSIEAFISGQINRKGMEESYQKNWNLQFARRLQTGRIIQRFFGTTFWSILLVRVLKPLPSIVRFLIRRTHGKPF